MSWWMEIMDSSPAPKRGDLIYSNLGTRKERTWMILRSVPIKRSVTRRYAIMRARWWELEPDMRMRLYQSAERRGGQIAWETRPLRRPVKKKHSVNFGL